MNGTRTHQATGVALRPPADPAVAALPSPGDHRLLLSVLGAAVAASWVALAAWGRSGWGYMLSHERLGTAGVEALGGLMAGWLLMTVAMMLPGSMGLIAWFHGVARSRARRTVMVSLLVAGYLSAWALFGLAVHTGDWALHRTASTIPSVGAAGWAVGPLVLLAAGLYQFTPLKQRCLRRCCTLPHLSSAEWAADGRPARLAFRLGVQEGVWTLGCCWALMLLMFVAGMSSLAHMVALGAVMLVEKTVDRSRRLVTALLGGGLAAAGLVMLLLNTLNA